MARAASFIVIVGGIVYLWPILAGAADPPGAPEDKTSAVRLGLFKRIAEQVDVAIDEGEKSIPVKMLAEPLYRYRQASRSTPDAIVWGSTDGGRPAAILTLACTMDGNSRMLTYEFDRLSAKPLTCTIDRKESWVPNGPGIEMATFPKAAAPADDAPARLKQVDRLLSRLKGTEVFDKAPAGQSQQADLAWLPEPVHRYSDAKRGIIDGFLCFSCIDTNPEVVLVLEAWRRENSAPVWRYGFNRIAFAELHVFLDHEEIWTAPHLNGTSPEGDYHLIAVQLHPQAAAENGKLAVARQDDDELNSLLRALLLRSEDRKRRYDVPQGDVAALVNCIARMAQFRPVDPEDQVEHQRRFRPALEEAAQRIVKLEKDHDCEAYQAARFILLQNRVYWMARAVPAERRRVVADVNAYLKEQLMQGNPRMGTNLAETTARKLQRIGEWDEAIRLYESFASRYAGNSDAEIAGWGNSMRDEAQRLRVLNANAPKLAAPEIAPQGKLSFIDLSRTANWGTSDWKRGSFEGNGLAELPKGEQSLGGVRFAIGEKWLQLGGPFHSPMKIEGIPVGRKLHRLYLLQGTQGRADRPDGATLATYKIRYTDGSEGSWPVELGKDVRSWYDFDQGRPVSRGRVIWTGSNTSSSQKGATLRLYLGVWENPHPEKPVATIAFTKAANEPLYAPFCLAITAEE